MGQHGLRHAKPMRDGQGVRLTRDTQQQAVGRTQCFDIELHAGVLNFWPLVSI
jgi:hypothetical protein